ncbi:MAG TPA: threonine ammonia-lyase, partial [Acidimicrobiales bacterium]
PHPDGEPVVAAADVRRAAELIRGQVVRTPALASRTLSAITGANVWLKFENLQFTASFKDRGALVRLLSLSPSERQRGVVAVSAGNHAQGVAHHSGRLGIPCTIVMPRHTPNVKVANTEALGARVLLHGEDLAQASARADELAATEGLVFVPPYDDADVIAGQGTVALELLDDVPGLEVVVVPIGGGGLIAGMAVALADAAPRLEIVGVQVDQYASFRDETVRGGATIAEGIAVARPGTITGPIVARLVPEVLTVDDQAIEHAVTLLLEIEKTVVEGAGAAGLAALLTYAERFAGRTVALILSGGNIDARLLASVILRGLIRSGRLSTLHVEVADVPGSLSRLTQVVGDAGGNIVEVAHQRLLAGVSVKTAVVELAVETRDRDHADRIVAALGAAGYRVTVA